MNMRRALLGTLLLGACVGAESQVVTFSDPSAWMTHRSNTFTARAQLDTAKIGEKNIRLVLYSMTDGRKRTIASKTVAADDFVKKFELGSLSEKVIGGDDYLGIEWNVQGGTQSGTCEPIGLVVLDELPKHTPIAAREISTGGDPAKVPAALQEGDFHAVGGQSLGVGWDSTALWFAFKHSEFDGVVEVALDGKNGKNAFLAYADRLVRYAPSADSVHTFHYRRQVQDGAVAYREARWRNETIISSQGDYTVVGLRWHDIGVIPQDKRTVGCGAFEIDAGGKTIASLHEGSTRMIPGTWGNLQLVK